MPIIRKDRQVWFHTLFLSVPKISLEEESKMKKFVRQQPYNTTAADIDIGGWTFDGATINTGVVVPANGYVVLDDNNTSGISITN